MVTRTLKRKVKRPSAQPGNAARPAAAAKKSAGGKAARPARAAAVPAKAKPKQAEISRSGGGKVRVARAVQFQQCEGWEMIDVADGIAVHDGAFKCVHHLNHTAAIVFILCKQPISLNVLCSVFREEFGLKAAPKAELREIISQMEKTKLLRPVQPGRAKARAAREARKS